MQRIRFRLASLLALVVISRPFAAAQEPAAIAAPDLKRVPLMQVEPLPHHQAKFLRGDREVARYHFDPADRRPFIYPIVGPSGLSLTRIGHPHDPVGHSHHNSFWVSHHIVNGVNFWGDRGPKLGRIVPQVVERLADADESAWLIAVNHWIDEETKDVLLVERRRIEVRPLPADEFLTVIDLEFTADKKPRTLEKTPFGMVAARVRKSMTVHDGGGRIRNSEGAVNEKGTRGDGTDGVFWKPARWCDYSGPVSAKSIEGITLFDHPSNFNHPTVFHVRDDGWMGAALTYDKPYTIEPGKKLRLRYGLWAHNGAPELPMIDEQWKAFTQLPVPETLEKPKPTKK